MTDILVNPPIKAKYQNTRRHATTRMTDSQTSLETVFPWEVVVSSYERGRWFQLINKDESELGDSEFIDAVLEYGGRDEEGNEL